MFQLNLSDFHNDENQENYKKFLSCEKSETGSHLQIRQLNQLKKMIQNHNQLHKIYEIVSAFPFDEVDMCYHYSRDSKFCAIFQSLQLIGIWDLEKDQLIKSIKNKNGGKTFFVALTSDNTTLLQISQEEEETIFDFNDFLEENYYSQGKWFCLISKYLKQIFKIRKNLFNCQFLSYLD